MIIAPFILISILAFCSHCAEKVFFFRTSNIPEPLSMNFSDLRNSPEFKVLNWYHKIITQ